MPLHEQVALRPALAARPLAALEITQRTKNALMRAGITTIGQLCALSELDVLQIRNIGIGGLQEIRDALEHLRASIESQPAQDEPTLGVSSMDGAERAVQTFGEQYSLPQAIAVLPVSVLKLSQRTMNALYRGSIHRLGPLAKQNRASLGALQNVGTKGLDEVASSLEALDVAELQSIAADFSQIEQLPLSVLALREPTIAGLAANGISTIGELLKAYESGAISQLDLAAQHIHEVVREITQLDYTTLRDRSASSQSTGPRPADQVDVELGRSITVQEYVARLLAELPERDRRIVMLRHGLEDDTAYTLEQVAQRYEMTREWVRQIETKALVRVQQRRQHIQPLLERLEYAVEQHAGVLSLEAAQAALCEMIDCSGVNPERAVTFLIKLTTTIAQVKGWPIIARNTGGYGRLIAEIPAICGALKQVLVDAHAPIDAEEICRRASLSAAWPKGTTAIPDDFVRACLNAHPEINVEPDGTYALKKWQSGRLDDMIQILRQERKPLH